MLNNDMLCDADYQRKKRNKFFMVIRDMVFHFACLDAEQLHIGMLYGACLALWGCGHTCSIRVRNGNLLVYNQWGYHFSPDRSTSP